MKRFPHVLIGLSLVLYVAGCSESHPTTATATSTTNSPTAEDASTARASSSTSNSPTVITISEADNGRTVSAHTGDGVIAVLHSTYWSFDPPSRDGITPDGPATVTPDLRGCVPGSGCGTATARYRIVATGQTTLSAHRNSCGEALACTGGQGDWTVIIDVPT